MTRGYPRPQFERDHWISLDGEWDFAMDPDGDIEFEKNIAWSSKIQVPFAPETTASGIGFSGFCRAFWYAREFDAPELDGGRLLLHFGAVDYRAAVWVNGALAATHEGGYTPFECDVTGLLRKPGRQRIVVRAEDDPADLAKPRGKQDWQLHPHSIWYPRTSGIWRTVWMERVPSTYLAGLSWTSNLERWEIGLEAHVCGSERDGCRVRVRLVSGENVLAEDTYSVHLGEVYRRIALSDPGIDDFRNVLLWSPERPTLIEASVTLTNCDGLEVDRVKSYTALRAISVQGNRFVLNGKPVYLRMALDQGYWPQSGMTAPDDEALRRDVELAKAMGFNGVRKHQKIEDPRYLYWADHLGLLVWEEMPSAYRFTTVSIERLMREWSEAMKRDRSHPCIVTWVPFNESWGVPDLPDSASQRHYVQALYHLTKTIDPTRPVVGNDGWESVATDIIGIHDYEGDAPRLAQRYQLDDDARLLNRQRPGGRMLVLAELSKLGQPIVLSEFGGVAYSRDSGTWGYTCCGNAEEFLEAFQRLIFAARSSELLAGYCYTQFSDTYQEANGLLFADRTPKIPIEDIARANLGESPLMHDAPDIRWRERLMEFQRNFARLIGEER